MMHRGVALGVLAALAACGPLPTPSDGGVWYTPVAPSKAPETRLPRLHTSGNQLLDEANQPVHLRGVNVCSLEFDREGRNWELSDAGSGLLQTLADPSRWNVRAVRMPVNQQWFLEDEAYVSLLERLIDDANRIGLYVVLDVQWEVDHALDPYSKNILELPTFGEGNTTEAFWLKATSRWATRTNVLYDLINEPHGHDDVTTAKAMQTLVSAIRTRTDTPIVIGGMNWAHSLEYYAAHPLAGENLVYSAHQYLPSDPPSTFSDHFVDAAKTIPVLLGEFQAEANQALYASQVVDAAEGAGAVGWMPWAIGCGFDKDADRGGEPWKTLAEKLRMLP